jgi:hypothetical protein
MGLAGTDYEIKEHILPSGRPLGTVVAHSLTWLRIEGFTHSPHRVAYSRLTLTAKALAAMNATPSGLDMRLGDQLAEAAKGAASEAGKSAIGAVVGEVIGGFVKGALGG